MTTGDVKVALPLRFGRGPATIATAHRARAKSSWWRWGVMLVSLVGLVALFRSLPSTNWFALLARVGPILPLLCGVALAWMALYARGLWVILGGAVGWGRLVYNRFMGEAYNVVMPIGDVGGDPFRIVDLGAEIGTADAVRAIVLDRLTYATSGLIFSAASSLAAVFSFTWDGRLEHLLAGYAIAALVAALVLFLVATRPESGRWIARALKVARINLSELPSPLPIRVFARALGWNLLGRAGVLVEIGVLLLALGQPVRLAAIVATGALLSVAGMVFFFVPGGIGVNEGAAVFALKLTGYDEAVGLSIGLARRVRQLVLAAAGVALSGLWHPGARNRALPGAILRVGSLPAHRRGVWVSRGSATSSSSRRYSTRC